MRRALYAALTLVLTGCPTPTDDDDSTVEPVWTDDDDWDELDDDDSAAPADDDDATPPVPNAVLYEPADGATGVSPSRAVVVDFEHEGARGEITLTDPLGAEVAGRTLQASLERLVFLSDGLLAPSTLYTATVAWPTGEHTWSFTTNASGSDPFAILPTDVTLHWSLTTSVVSPPGAGVFLGIADVQLLTQITNVTDMDMTMLGAVSTDGDQDLCAPTFDPTEADSGVFVDPTFSAGPTAFAQLIDLTILGYGLVQIPFRDAQLAGVLYDDGNSNYAGVESGRFVGVVDVRDVNIPDACDTLGSVGLPCVPCPFDLTSEACVVFILDDLTAAVQPGLQLEPRTSTDVVNDPGCQ